MITSLQNSYADGLLFQALAERLGTRLIVFSRILKPWGNRAEKRFSCQRTRLGKWEPHGEDIIVAIGDRTCIVTLADFVGKSTFFRGCPKILAHQNGRRLLLACFTWPRKTQSCVIVAVDSAGS